MCNECQFRQTTQLPLNTWIRQDLEAGKDASTSVEKPICKKKQKAGQRYVRCTFPECNEVTCPMLRRSDPRE